MCCLFPKAACAAPEDVAVLREIGADAVLIGEALMRAADKRAKLDELRGVGMTKIKLCGLSRPCDIEAANELEAGLYRICVRSKKQAGMSHLRTSGKN